LRENWELCNPLQWWVGRWAQFPRLFCFARDLLAIPGMSQIILMVTLGELRRNTESTEIR
jgi:hypothetical protein